MQATIMSATTIGVHAHQVSIEVDIALGLVSFHIIGLPDTAIKESTKRITTALSAVGIKLPAKRILVNLAPADLKKEGTTFDLPIAVGIVCAARIVQVAHAFLQETLFLGELSLDGSVRPVKGVLAIARHALAMGKKRLVVAADNAAEAALIPNLEVLAVSNITQLIAYLRGEQVLLAQHPSPFVPVSDNNALDFAQVKGQQQAKRALQICAAGRHNIVLIGSPGSGKTMLASRLPTIMPPMTFEQMLQTSTIYSVSGKWANRTLLYERPFRNPHHTISSAGLIGGGAHPQPGEISLAHNGILFLDELAEFKRSSLEALRQPLESHEVCIARAQSAVTFPARFLLVAGFNPCPCGYFGDKRQTCTCSQTEIARYFGKLSGPLLDRIDIAVGVQSLDYDDMKVPVNNQESSQHMADAVRKAIDYQQKRYNTPDLYNAYISASDIERYCVLSCAAEQLLKKAFDKLALSMRGYHKILKVARTIADLEQKDIIDVAQIQEAILYRSVDSLQTKNKAF